MKITVTYRDTDLEHTYDDVYEAEHIGTMVLDGFLTVSLHDDMSDGPYGQYQKNRKAMYPQHSVRKVVTE